MARATLGTEGFRITVLVDDVIVGHGDSGKRGRASCEALMNELNKSDEKCDSLKQYFTED